MNKYLLAFALFVVLISMSGNAQEIIGPAPPSECIKASEYHLRHQLNWSESNDQEFHERARVASELMDARGISCDGWQQDAKAAAYAGNFTEVKS